MTHRSDKHTVVLGLVGALVTAASPGAARAGGIAAGWDYWVTVAGDPVTGAGSQSTFDPGSGPLTIFWQGVPFGLCETEDADTAVRRLVDLGDPMSALDQTVGIIDIELVALSLRSVEPITIPGLGDYDLTARVDVDPLTFSDGTMQILTHTDLVDPDVPLGTWIALADFNAHPRIEFFPIGGAPSLPPIYDTINLATDISDWQHESHDLSIVVPCDPDGAGPLGPTSNWFAIGGVVHFGPHAVTIPEPATLSLLALGGLMLTRRRRRWPRRVRPLTHYFVSL